MEEKRINNEEHKEELKQLLQKGENGIPIKRKIDYTKFAPRKVYNRKILRNILKRTLGTNKIRNAWHQLRAEGRI